VNFVEWEIWEAEKLCKTCPNVSWSITNPILLLLLLLLTANGFSPGGSGTTIKQTKYKLTTIRQHTI
jgi:hypothetical protein